MAQLHHIGEAIDGTEPGTEPGSGLSVEIDEARPELLLITTVSEEHVTESLYVRPQDARMFANALQHYAHRAEPGHAFAPSRLSDSEL